MKKKYSHTWLTVLLIFSHIYFGCVTEKSYMQQERDSVDTQEESQPELEKINKEKEPQQGILNPDMTSAIWNGDIKSVTEQLRTGIDINFRDPYSGDTLLFVACTAGMNGNFDIVKLLLDQGADPNIISRSGVTALMLASLSGNMNIVELLLEHKAKVEVIDDNVHSAMDWALAVGNKEIYARLKGHLDEQAFKNEILSTKSEIKKLRFELRIAIWDSDATKFAELINNVEPNNSNIINPHLLCDAIRYGEIEIVNILLDFGVDTDTRDSFYQKPLFAACFNGNDEIVRLLLEHGVDINDFPTPLTAATRNGHLSTVKLLISNGADIHLRDGANKTALDYAIEKGYDEIADLLRNEM